jgi:hypothetical protein
MGIELNESDLVDFGREDLVVKPTEAEGVIYLAEEKYSDKGNHYYSFRLCFKVGDVLISVRHMIVFGVKQFAWKVTSFLDAFGPFPKTPAGAVAVPDAEAFIGYRVKAKLGIEPGSTNATTGKTYAERMKVDQIIGKAKPPTPEALAKLKSQLGTQEVVAASNGVAEAEASELPF